MDFLREFPHEPPGDVRFVFEVSVGQSQVHGGDFTFAIPGNRGRRAEVVAQVAAAVHTAEGFGSGLRYKSPVTRSTRRDAARRAEVNVVLGFLAERNAQRGSEVVHCFGADDQQGSAFFYVGQEFFVFFFG